MSEVDSSGGLIVPKVITECVGGEKCNLNSVSGPQPGVAYPLKVLYCGGMLLKYFISICKRY